MMDLEDGIAPGEKEATRSKITASLDQVADRIDSGSFARTPALMCELTPSHTIGCVMILRRRASGPKGTGPLAHSRCDFFIHYLAGLSG